MGLPIRLHSILFGALVTLPLLLTMFPAKMLLYPSQIAESSRWIMVDTCGLRAHVNPLLHLLTGSLPQLPWKVVTSPVELQILVSLKPFVANFTHEAVGGQ